MLLTEAEFTQGAEFRRQRHDSLFLGTQLGGASQGHMLLLFLIGEVNNEY